MRHWLIVGILGVGLGLSACDSNSDNARSATGPGISVHCAAQTPIGDTTTVVKCAPQEASQ